MGLFSKLIGGAAKSAGSSLWGAAKEAGGDLISQGVSSLFGGGDSAQPAPAPAAPPDAAANAPGMIGNTMLGGDGGLGAILGALGGGLGNGGLGGMLAGLLGGLT